MWYYTIGMNKKQKKTLEKISETPERSDISWSNIESLLISLGGEITEGRGSRVLRHVFFCENRRAYRPGYIMVRGNRNGAAHNLLKSGHYALVKGSPALEEDVLSNLPVSDNPV